MIIFWILTMVFIIIGFILGYLLPFNITAAFFPYMTVFFLALLDSFLFNLYLIREEIHRIWSVIVRLILEMAFGCFLIFFGDQAGLDLYLVAVIPLGASAFYNLHKILTPRVNHSI